MQKVLQSDLGLFRSDSPVFIQHSTNTQRRISAGTPFTWLLIVSATPFHMLFNVRHHSRR